MQRPDEQCAYIHQIVRRLARHNFPPPDDGIPANGLYFIFEAGEIGHGDDRIVRVGSHTGRGNLAARLKEHISLNKDRSIFRKNMGRALLCRDGDPFLKEWNLDLTKRTDRDKYMHLIDQAKQGQVEQAVSEHILGAMSFCVVGTANRELALRLEQGCIATISLCGACCASPSWLGRFSPNPKIRESGLWQVQHLYGEPLSAGDLRMLEAPTGGFDQQPGTR